MKSMWSSVNPVCQNMSQVRKIMFKQVVPVLFQCFLTLGTIMVVNNHLKHYCIECQLTGFLCGKKLQGCEFSKTQLFMAFLCTQGSLHTTYITFSNHEFKMASSEKVCNLAEAVDFVLDSDNEYSKDLSSDEQTDKECDPCYRVSLNFVDNNDPGTKSFTMVCWLGLGLELWTRMFIFVCSYLLLLIIGYLQN